MSTVAEILEACKRSQTGKVYINVPGEPRGERMYLAGRRSPLGLVLCCPSKGGTTCLFDVLDVLAWLQANKLAEIEIVTERAEGGEGGA